MPNPLIKNGQIFLQSLNKQENICKNFILNSKTNDNNIGVIFGIIEINSNNKNYYRFITDIINELEEDYQKIENLYEQNIDSVNPETVFEKTLQKINYKIAKLIKNKSFRIDLKKINAIIAIAHPPANRNEKFKLFFSHIGNINAFLIHKTKESSKSINIISKVNSDDPALERPNPVRLFSHIINGEIGAGDYVFMANENILDYISIDNIKKIVTNLPPSGSAGQIQNTLSDINSNKTFTGVIIELKKAPVPCAEESEAAIKKASTKQYNAIEKLYNTEEATEQLLTPSLNIKTKILSLLKKLKVLVFGFKLPKINFKLLLKKIRQPKRYASPQEECEDTKEEKTTPVNVNISKRLFGKFNNMPKISKVLFIGAIIFIIIFFQSLSSMQKKKEEKQKIAQYNQVLGAIEQKQSEAEASLIYNDENTARQILSETAEMIKKLPNETLEQKEKIEFLFAGNNLIHDKLKKITKIGQPALLANLNNSADDIHLTQIFKKDDLLLTFNTLEHTVFTINTASSNVNAIDISALNIGSFLKGTIHDDYLILYHDNPGLIKIDLKDENNSFENTDVEIEAITDIGNYNKNIYILDAPNNSIKKYIPIESGYSSARNWIKDSSDVSEGVTMYIDGFIYILKSNGEIIRFLSGKQNLTVPAPVMDPPINNLTSDSKLFVSDQSKLIYVTDPANKRLIVFTRKGKLVTQYFSESFKNLNDFIVIEDEKKIYLLSDGKIYGIIASHL